MREHRNFKVKNNENQFTNFSETILVLTDLLQEQLIFNLITIIPFVKEIPFLVNFW